MLEFFQITNPVIGPAGTGPGDAILGNIISALIGFVLVVGTIGALVFFMLGALRWITSSGDKNKLQAAQEEITHAVVGLMILAAGWAIFMLVTQFTGIGVFDETGTGTFQLPTLNDSGTTQASCPGNFCQGGVKSCADVSTGSPGGMIPAAGTCDGGRLCCQPR